MKEEASPGEEERDRLDKTEVCKKKTWETPRLSQLKTEQTHGGAVTPGPDGGNRS